MRELERAGAILLDHHFVYKSKKHGPHYINVDPLLPETALMSSLIDAMVLPWIYKTVEVVTGPPIGGMLLADKAASRWPGVRPPELIWPEKDGDGFVFDRAGFGERLKGKRVIIWEDLLNTGGSVKKVRELCEQYRAEVIGVAAICNRGGASAEDLGVPCLETQASVEFEAFEADECPLCAAGKPIVEDIGHGASYKAEHPDYPGSYVRLLD